MCSPVQAAVCCCCEWLRPLPACLPACLPGRELLLPGVVVHMCAAAAAVHACTPAQLLPARPAWRRASVTLEVGVKIYSNRVDSVHTETFKILGGLGRASGPADEPEGAASGGCDCAGRVPQWRKTKIAGLRIWI